MQSFYSGGYTLPAPEHRLGQQPPLQWPGGTFNPWALAATAAAATAGGGPAMMMPSPAPDRTLPSASQCPGSGPAMPVGAASTQLYNQAMLAAMGYPVFATVQMQQAAQSAAVAQYCQIQAKAQAQDQVFLALIPWALISCFNLPFASARHAPARHARCDELDAKSHTLLVLLSSASVITIMAFHFRPSKSFTGCKPRVMQRRTS